MAAWRRNLQIEGARWERWWQAAGEYELRKVLYWGEGSDRRRRKRSLYAAALAQQLAADCGGLCTPALRNPVGQPLTGRQREIIELVAAGLSKKEIAERLVTSVRTVEGHVYRAYQRLGAGSREELVEILRASQGGSLSAHRS